MRPVIIGIASYVFVAAVIVLLTIYAIQVWR